MADKKEDKQLILEESTRQGLLEGALAAYQAVSTSYGPRGKNVLIERNFGRPTLTRDGWTIIREVFFNDRLKNMGAQILTEASTAANLIAGDGSSATVVLAYHLLKNSILAINAGQHPMDIRDTLDRDAITLLEALEKMAVPVKDAQLKEVATVSSGDPLLGQLIAEAVLYVGRDGGILTEKAPINETEREYIDGYYLQSGFAALQASKKELQDPYVIVSSKRLSSAADTIEILNGIMKAKNLQQGQIPRILFVGNIEGDALTTIINTINQGMIDAVVIPTPPMYGEYGKYLLSDIALYANCEPITESTNIKSFVVNRDGQPHSDYIGSVKRVTANKAESTIFADNEAEAVQVRIAEIKDQIEAEQIPAVLEKLKDRVAKLEGKICLFRIGGPIDSEREEKEFRVEDAINSTRNAHNEGIVPGGGVTLLELSKLDISDIYRKSLRSTFQQLLINANLPAEIKLAEALAAPKGRGYNLRKGDTLVDMIKDGIIDAAIVPRETIRNATSAVGGAVTIGASLIFTDTEK
jgi:chaperonin GroEL